MHKHNELICQHELKYCKPCDIVFCEKCKSEWSAKHLNLSDYFKPTKYKSSEEPVYPPPTWSSRDVIPLCSHSV